MPGNIIVEMSHVKKKKLNHYGYLQPGQCRNEENREYKPKTFKS